MREGVGDRVSRDEAETAADDAGCCRGSLLLQRAQAGRALLRAGDWQNVHNPDPCSGPAPKSDVSGTPASTSAAHAALTPHASSDPSACSTCIDEFID